MKIQIPKPEAKASLMVMVKQTLFNQLKDAAKKDKVSMRDIVEYGIRIYLEQRDRK